MKTQTLLLIFVALVAVYLLAVPHTKIQEPDAEYYTTPDPGPGPDITVVTPDELDKVITLTQKALSDKIGKCTYCIETTNINLTGNTYNGRFMFMALTGFPYGIGVDSTVQKGPNGPETVTSINLQATQTIDEIDPFDEFKQGSEILKSSEPSIADLQSALNNT
jgi:hypothetical protein